MAFDEDLADRLQRRMDQLKLERSIVATSPVIRGGFVIVPAGLLAAKSTGGAPDGFSPNAEARKRIEEAAMNAVIAQEKALGNKPEDVSAQKVGYDVLSLSPETGKYRFIEVKGRVEGARTVTVTRNEIITSLNKPDDFIDAFRHDSLPCYEVGKTILESRLRNSHPP